MEGENLKKANEWFSKAVLLEEKNQPKMMERAIEKAIEFEAAGIAVGESWEK